MPTISIQLDDETHVKIEQHRGDVNKSEYYRQIVDYYLRQYDYVSTIDIDNLITAYKTEITYLKNKLDEAMALLVREQALIIQLQTQQKLLPSKHWWQFWKR